MGSGDGSEEPPRAPDQVGVARDWLRSQGVDPPPELEQRPARARSQVEVEGAGDYDPRRKVESRWVRRTKTEGGPPSIGAGTGGPETDVDDVDAAEADGAGVAGSRGSRAGKRRGERSKAEPRRAGLDPDADPEEVARTIVLRKLAAQARTRAELARALETREVPEEAATAVLDRMTEVGLVDDATFAHDWVASRQQRRHLSKTALRRELQTKGVDRDLIDDALTGVDGDDEHRAALDLAQRRASRMAGLERDVAYRRLGGVLARRGFSSSVTVQVLAEVLDGRGDGSSSD